MGLDLTHRKNKGSTLACSYSGFAGFRKALCEAAGYGDLDQYQGFGGTKPCLHWRKDPLWALLNHSDCEGQIGSRRNLRGIAKRLRELTPKLSDWHVGYADRLAQLCDECADKRVPLEFR